MEFLYIFIETLPPFSLKLEHVVKSFPEVQGIGKSTSIIIKSKSLQEKCIKKNKCKKQNYYKKKEKKIKVAAMRTCEVLSH